MLVAGSVTVAATGVLVASCLRLREAVGFLLAGYVVASTEIVAVSMLLSMGRWLTRGALLTAILCTLALTFAMWVRLGRPRPPMSRATGSAIREALRDPVVATLCAFAVVVHLYLLAVALTVPQSLSDTMTYQLPRAALWKQQHAVAYIADAPDLRLNAFSPNAQIETMASMILSRGDRYVALVQLAALLAICLSIVGIARRLGLSRAAALFGALAFSIFTVVVLQTPTALNDLVVAAALSVSAYFVMGRSRTDLVLAASALALALGTKLTAVYALPALALFALSTQPRRRWASLALAAAGGVAAGSFWLLVNLAETGQLNGGVVLVRAENGPLERIELSFVDLFELSDVDGKHLLTSPFWGLVLLAVSLVAAATLAVLRKWGSAIAVGVSGVFAAFALPLLTTWARVASHAYEQVRATLGVSVVPTGPRLPEGFYESPMHSSYGLSFVLLFFGVGAVVVVEVQRRLLPLSALLALMGVPLTVVLSALALAADPQRMRYVAFPVALAASVFGLALRVRPLAWAVVGLTAATLVVLSAYFVPRPAGLALLPGHGGSTATARWFVQGGGGSGDRVTFRFLEHSVPSTATLAIDTNGELLYPAWDAGLRRRVLFVTANGRVPPEAGWLVIGPSEGIATEALSGSGWTLVFRSPAGWRVLERRSTG